MISKSEKGVLWEYKETFPTPNHNSRLRAPLGLLRCKSVLQEPSQEHVYLILLSIKISYIQRHGLHVYFHPSLPGPFLSFPRGPSPQGPFPPCGQRPRKPSKIVFHSSDLYVFMWYNIMGFPSLFYYSCYPTTTLNE